MKLSIRKKMLMLGGICLVSMLITFGIFLLQQSARKRKNSSNNKKFDQ